MSKPGFIKNWQRVGKRRSFLRSGMKPWTRGYIEYKLDEIARVLRLGSFPSGDLTAGYGHRLDERIVE
jgi:hypothetical protein